MLLLPRLAAAALLLLPASALADTIALGVFSFDNLIPAGSGPGVNVFDIGNFTGAFDLPPDLPVSTPVTFLNSVLMLDLDGGGSENISLGDIAPGVFSPPASAEFPDTTLFTSATLTATLDNVVLSLDGGGTFTAASVELSATILPSSGPDLAAGTDFAVISASNVVTTPEPSTGVLVAGMLMAGFLIKRRNRI